MTPIALATPVAVAVDEAPPEPLDVAMLLAVAEPPEPMPPSPPAPPVAAADDVAAPGAGGGHVAAGAGVAARAAAEVVHGAAHAADRRARARHAADAGQVVVAVAAPPTLPFALNEEPAAPPVADVPPTREDAWASTTVSVEDADPPAAPAANATPKPPAPPAALWNSVKSPVVDPDTALSRLAAPPGPPRREFV